MRPPPGPDAMAEDVSNRARGLSVRTKIAALLSSDLERLEDGWSDALTEADPHQTNQTPWREASNLTVCANCSKFSKLKALNVVPVFVKVELWLDDGTAELLTAPSSASVYDSVRDKFFLNGRTTLHGTRFPS